MLLLEKTLKVFTGLPVGGPWDKRILYDMKFKARKYYKLYENSGCISLLCVIFVCFISSLNISNEDIFQLMLSDRTCLLVKVFFE